MGRRPVGALPVMRRHKLTNTARVVIGGRVHSLGRWRSPEARQRYDQLIAAYKASGGRSVDAALTREDSPAGADRPAAALPGVPAATIPAAAPEPLPAVPAGLTVADLALRWLRDIEATTPGYRRTSKWHGALAASRAVRPFATMPVDAFGSRALVEVQRHLVEMEIQPRRENDDDAPRPQKRLSRRYINDVIGRVRQMFNWGVLQELVPDDRVKALEVVAPLAKGQTKARDAPAKADPAEHREGHPSLSHGRGSGSHLVHPAHRLPTERGGADEVVPHSRSSQGSVAVRSIASQNIAPRKAATHSDWPRGAGDHPGPHRRPRGSRLRIHAPAERAAPRVSRRRDSDKASQAVAARQGDVHERFNPAGHHSRYRERQQGPEENRRAAAAALDAIPTAVHTAPRDSQARRPRGGTGGRGPQPRDDDRPLRAGELGSSGPVHRKAWVRCHDEKENPQS